MSLIKVLAIEDELPALKRLVKMIENHPNLVLAETARNAAEAEEKILKLLPDLILLDIQLKDTTAFELLSKVKKSFTGKIIFCTAYDQYALKAFDVQAIDYLLKPYSEERFNASIDRILAQNTQPDFKKLFELLDEKQSDLKTIRISEGNKNYFLNSDTLLYVIADGYYSYFILNNDKKMIRISLKKLEEILPNQFIRINKSTILNKNFILEMVLNKASSKVTMTDRNEFDVSDKYIVDFQRQFS